MELLFIIAGFILVSVLVWNLMTKSKEKSAGRLPPGPAGLPFIGQGGQLSANSAHLQFTEWSKQYGDVFMFQIFGKKVAVFNNPDIIRKAFADSDVAHLTSDRPGSFIGRQIADTYRDILFRRYDEVCEKLKQTTLRAMHTSAGKNSEQFLPIQEEVQEYIERITRSKGEDVDIIQPLEATLCKLIGLLFTGKRLSDEDLALRAILEFDRNGNEMILPATHMTLKFLPFLRFFPGYYGNLYRKTLTSKSNLRTCLMHKLKDEYSTAQRTCLLHALFSIQENEKWLTDDLILGVIMDLINTSTLTSRGVLSGIYFLLIHYQTVQDKICTEIDNVIGQDRTPSPQDMSKMPYTYACILETLRFQSHLGITATHTNSSADITVGEFLIPRGTSLYGNQWAVHHDESFWKDPWVFRPDRFLDNDGNLLPVDHERRMRYYMPFGVGNRSCMGVTTTYQRMFLFVTTLLQKHKLLPPSTETLPSCDPRDLIPGTVLQAPQFMCRVVSR